MVLADEEDHLEFLKKCGFSNYYGLDGSATIFRVAPRGKFNDLEVKKEEIEALVWLCTLCSILMKCCKRYGICLLNTQ